MNESDFGLTRYLRDIGQFTLLTPQQEIELAKKLKMEMRQRAIG